MPHSKLRVILGGTFDPVHLGHITIATHICQSLEVEQFYFLPCKQPVHKTRTVTPVNHRLAMLKLAITHHPTWHIDEREIHSTNPNYMVTSLMSIRNEYRAPLALLVGSDALCQLTQWYQWQRLFELAHLIVVPRHTIHPPDSGPIANIIATRQVHHKKYLYQQVQGLIFMHDMPIIDLSSSLIRERIQQGLDVAQLLPPSVWQYIQTHQLYY